MPSFTVVDKRTYTPKGDGWREAARFSHKDQIVDIRGRPITSDTIGHKYQLVSKYELDLSGPQRACRSIVGVVLSILSLGTLLFSKKVRALFTLSKWKVRYGIKIKAPRPAYIPETVPSPTISNLQPSTSTTVVSRENDEQKLERFRYQFSSLYTSGEPGMEDLSLEELRNIYKLLLIDEQSDDDYCKQLIILSEIFPFKAIKEWAAENALETYPISLWEYHLHKLEITGEGLETLLRYSPQVINNNEQMALRTFRILLEEISPKAPFQLFLISLDHGHEKARELATLIYNIPEFLPLLELENQELKTKILSNLDCFSNFDYKELLAIQNTSLQYAMIETRACYPKQLLKSWTLEELGKLPDDQQEFIAKVLSNTNRCMFRKEFPLRSLMQLSADKRDAILNHLESIYPKLKDNSLSPERLLELSVDEINAL